METIVDKLRAFVNQAADWPRAVWIKDSLVDVYVRKSRRFIDGVQLTCLDLANITVNERHRGKGLFSKTILPAFVELNPWDAVYIECVQNPRLLIFLIDHAGFTSLGGIPPNLYLLKGKPNEKVHVETGASGLHPRDGKDAHPGTGGAGDQPAGR